MIVVVNVLDVPVSWSNDRWSLNSLVLYDCCFVNVFEMYRSAGQMIAGLQLLVK